MMTLDMDYSRAGVRSGMRLLLASVSMLALSPAAAQIPGQFPANTFYGGPATVGANPALPQPRRITPADLPLSVLSLGAKCDAVVGGGGTDDTLAIRAAIAATQAGDTLEFPNTWCLISGSGAEVLLFNRAINIIGSGMQGGGILVKSTVPNSTDILHFVPPLGGMRGSSIRELAIQAQSGAPGRHVVNIDTTSANNIFAAEFEIRRNWIYGTSAGNSIIYNNTSAGLGVFNSEITENLITGSVNLVWAGDSIRVSNNIISTYVSGAGNPLTISQLGGAGNIVIENNNITGGGGTLVHSATGLVFTHNEVEQITPNIEQVTQGVTNATTAAGNAVLHFAATPAGITTGMSVFDLTTGAAIPTGDTVLSQTGTTVTMLSNAAAPGVGSGDVIGFGNNAMLDLVCDLAQCVRPLIVGNQIQANASTNAPNMVRITNSNGTVIDQNYFGSAAAAVAVINNGASAIGTVLGPNNTFVGTSAPITDTGVGTAYAFLPLAPNKVSVLANGNVGVGTETNPQQPFTASANATTGLPGQFAGMFLFAGKDGIPSGLEHDAFGVGAGGPNFIGRFARGTAAAKTAVQNGDQLFFMQGIGYDGSAFNVNQAQGWQLAASENWSTSTYGSQLGAFLTKPGTTIRTNVATLDGKAHLGFTLAAPAPSACGTAPAVTANSTDMAGEVTEGTTAAGCTITFANAFLTKAFCAVTPEQVSAAFSYSTSLSAITITNTSASGNKYSWQCSGN